MQRYPLTWPAGWPRRTDKRTVARFSTAERRPGTSWAYRRDVTVAEAIQRVLGELSRIGVAEGDSIISTNLETRLDGLPRSNQPEPDDPGVAVYWQVIGSPMRVMAIDRYDTVAGNLAVTLGAFGGIYIGGGIVPRLGERFARSGFRRAFEAKGRFRGYLEAIPTALITDTLAALGGSALAIEQSCA